MRRRRTLGLVSNTGGIREGGPGTAPGTAIYTGTPAPIITDAPTYAAAPIGTNTAPAVSAAPQRDYTYVDPPAPSSPAPITYPLPAGFDPWIYLASNPAVARYALSVFGAGEWAKIADYGTASYLEHGLPWNTFDAVAYAAANPTIAAYYGNDRRTLAIRFVQGGAVDPLAPAAPVQQPVTATPAASVGTPYASVLAGLTPDSLAALKYQLSHLDFSTVPVIVGGISFGGPGPFNSPIGVGGGGVITGVDVGGMPGGFGGVFGTGFSGGGGGLTDYGQAGKGSPGGVALPGGVTLPYSGFGSPGTVGGQDVETVTVTATGSDYDLQPVPVTPTEFSTLVPYTVPAFPIYAGTLTPPPVTPTSYADTLTPGLPAVPPETPPEEVVVVTATPIPPAQLTPPPVSSIDISNILTPGVPTLPPFPEEVVVVTATPIPPAQLTPPPVSTIDVGNVLTPGLPAATVADQSAPPPGGGTIDFAGTRTPVNVGTNAYGTAGGTFGTPGTGGTSGGGTPPPSVTQRRPSSSGAGGLLLPILLLLAAAATEAHNRRAR